MPLSNHEFLLLRRLIQERVGLFFEDRKHGDLERIVTRALLDYEMNHPSQLYNELRHSPTPSDLWKDFIARLTINETYFFRDTAQFRALREIILPELIAQRRRDNHRLIRLWSAGCATGEEPYSLAMLLSELIPDIADWSILILGTDINAQNLAYAQRGIYKERSFRNDTPSNLKQRFFEDTPQGYLLAPNIRRMVRFALLNLVGDGFPSAANFTLNLDLIVCRNVTIYFERQTTIELAARFHEALRKDGWLIVGHSEPMSSIYAGFKSQNYAGAIAYRKVLLPVEPPTAYIPTSLTSVPQDAAYKPSAPAPKLAETPQPSAVECYELAKEHANRNEWSTATEWLELALQKDPTLVSAQFLLGLFYMQSEAYEDAVHILKKAVYLDRRFVLAHFNLGVAYWNLGNVKAATRAWENAYDLTTQYEPDEVLPFGDDMTADYLAYVIKKYIQSAL